MISSLTSLILAITLLVCDVMHNLNKKFRKKLLWKNNSFDNKWIKTKEKREIKRLIIEFKLDNMKLESGDDLFSMCII